MLDGEASRALQLNLEKGQSTAVDILSGSNLKALAASLMVVEIASKAVVVVAGSIGEFSSAIYLQHGKLMPQAIRKVPNCIDIGDVLIVEPSLHLRELVNIVQTDRFELRERIEVVDSTCSDGSIGERSCVWMHYLSIPAITNAGQRTVMEKLRASIICVLHFFICWQFINHRDFDDIPHIVQLFDFK